MPFLSDVDPSLFDPLHQLNEAADARVMAQAYGLPGASQTSLYRTGGGGGGGGPAVDEGSLGLSSKKQRLQQFTSVAGFPPPSALLNQVVRRRTFFCSVSKDRRTRRGWKEAGVE